MVNGENDSIKILIFSGSSGYVEARDWRFDETYLHYDVCSQEDQ